jgi:hypothetical protein
MTRTLHPAFVAGYAVAFVVVMLGLVVVFGYAGPIEFVAAAVLAVPVTAAGARALSRSVDLDLEPEAVDPGELAAEQAEPSPSLAA